MDPLYGKGCSKFSRGSENVGGTAPCEEKLSEWDLFYLGKTCLQVSLPILMRRSSRRQPSENPSNLNFFMILRNLIVTTTLNESFTLSSDCTIAFSQSTAFSLTLYTLHQKAQVFCPFSDFLLPKPAYTFAGSESFLKQIYCLYKLDDFLCGAFT